MIDIVPACHDSLHWGQAKLVKSTTNPDNHLLSVDSRSFPLGSFVFAIFVSLTQLRVLHLRIITRSRDYSRIFPQHPHAAAIRRIYNSPFHRTQRIAHAEMG